jgi:hypothetical protein
MTVENPTGVFVSKELRLEMLIEGKGLGLMLTVEQARQIASVLLERAAEVETREAITKAAVLN